jgi:hypothetical protein
MSTWQLCTPRFYLQILAISAGFTSYPEVSTSLVYLTRRKFCPGLDHSSAARRKELNRSSSILSLKAFAKMDMESVELNVTFQRGCEVNGVQWTSAWMDAIESYHLWPAALFLACEDVTQIVLVLHIVDMSAVIFSVWLLSFTVWVVCHREWTACMPSRTSSEFILHDASARMPPKQKTCTSIDVLEFCPISYFTNRWKY